MHLYFSIPKDLESFSNENIDVVTEQIWIRFILAGLLGTLDKSEDPARKSR